MPVYVTVFFCELTFNRQIMTENSRYLLPIQSQLVKKKLMRRRGHCKCQLRENPSLREYWTCQFAEQTHVECEVPE